MASQETRNARYVSLATFRRSGKAVATPVWAAYREGVYYVFSAGDAGKVKRLRNSSRARLAKCDVRGNLLGGWHEARAELLRESGQIEIALDALRAKYGLWRCGSRTSVPGSLAASTSAPTLASS